MATKQQRENAELDGTSAAVPTRAAGEALALGTGDLELSLAGRLTRRLRPTRYLAERIQRPLKLRDCPQSRIAEQARTLNDLEERTGGLQLQEIEGERFLALRFDMWMVDSKHQIPPEIQA